MSNTNSHARGLLAAPILWGGVLSAGFYGLIHAGLLEHELMGRYFTSHPVEYVMTIMFFTGLAALVFKWFDSSGQARRMDSRVLTKTPQERQSVEEADGLIEQLDSLPVKRRREYYVQRLRDALGYIQAKGSASGLDDELKYLADQKSAYTYSDYGLVRTITWSIPILGFLGTVIGIAMAMGSLNPEELATSLPIVMSGLMVAFDTTTLALALSIVLVYAHFVVDRNESRLLADVERRVNGDLLSRFRQIDPIEDRNREALRESLDEVVVSMRGMIEEIVQAQETVLERQAETWQQTIEAANQRFARLTADASREMETLLSHALSESMAAHAQELVRAEAEVSMKAERRWERWQSDMSVVVGELTKMFKAMEGLEKGVSSHGETLRRLMTSSGQLASLEERLSKNLTVVSETGHFEETLNSLAAVVHLLNGRVSRLDGSEPQEQQQNWKKKNRNRGRAA